MRSHSSSAYFVPAVKSLDPQVLEIIGIEQMALHGSRNAETVDQFAWIYVVASQERHRRLLPVSVPLTIARAVRMIRGCLRSVL
jgi:hypothetical protein